MSRLLLRPIQIMRDYRARYLRSDLIAGLTVAVVMLPQAMACAYIADVPANMGLHTAIVGSVVAVLWGSSSQLQTCPTSAASLLVLSTLLGLEESHSPADVTAAGLLVIMVGVFRLVMGLARLGVLVGFVSDSMIVGFTTGAGVLIVFNQVGHLLRGSFSSSPSFWRTILDVLSNIPQTHLPSLALGLAAICIILALRRVDRRLLGPLIAMVGGGAVVALLGLEARGVQVVGKLPRSLPPLVNLSLLDPELAGELFTGSLAIATVGLVEAVSIARSISGETGQRLDSNQEFVGQGLANIASGLLSGYACSGSFSRSVVNYRAGAKTELASIFASLFVLAAALPLASVATDVPLATLAGALILTG